jgi:hypothetical protein
MAQKAAQRARARFTWTGIAQKLLTDVENLTDVVHLAEVRPKDHL